MSPAEPVRANRLGAQSVDVVPDRGGFTESRATEPGPDTFLRNFRGTIVADAFTGYKHVDQKTVISSAARHTLDVSAYLLDVLPKLAARALNPPTTNDDLDELLPDRWKRTHPEAVRTFCEDERRPVDDRKKDRRERRRREKQLSQKLQAEKRRVNSG